MWKTIVTYFPEWSVFAQAILACLIPYSLSIFLEKAIKKQRNNGKSQPCNPFHEPSILFSDDFAANLGLIKQDIGHHSDVIIREFHLGSSKIRAAVVFIDVIADKELINKQILQSLMHMETLPPDHSSLIDYLKDSVLSICQLKGTSRLSDGLSEIRKGSTVLLIDGSDNVLILGTRKPKSRNMEEPVSESLVRGPRIGFNENINDNIALLRQYGENRKLTVLNFQVGSRIKRELAVAYIEDIANPELVDEVIKRIRKIDMDDMPDSGYVEQLIEDNYVSPFSQVQNTERSDRVSSAMMEGRVAILLDGTPFVLIVPVTFSMLIQSPEDYYERWIPGSLLRLLRYLAAFVSTFGPSLYISLISFHQGMLPTKLAISIASTRIGVPFPSIIEALIMEVSIEILREAGLRLPKPIGQTIGIVGGLVIGEAAVQAGIVSPIMVIVVAVTAISSFAIPQYSVGITLRILRFGAMFSAALFGLYGVVLFFLLLCAHLVKLKSFGVMYASPTAPSYFSDWKDFMIRMPLQLMKRRPKMLDSQNPKRKS
ncbi:spore germination protein [Paenibacillus sp. MBLB4367]|uniref:spore germination protein n=1 Tax=Paenibacillus sp. MBLB4367 TaxID=3384767 RepID=UPI0039080305